ncbi:unnamed protein product, partial [Vitis vinifera]|uniref:Uncharacterized protein n=1 Tax=Vitis vinifera TaxID=29760 RepID=D7SYF1_VITVI
MTSNNITKSAQKKNEKHYLHPTVCRLCFGE